MKIQVREFNAKDNTLSERIPLFDDGAIAALSPSDGLILTATSEDEFGNESIYSIILEREEFEQIKKL